MHALVDAEISQAMKGNSKKSPEDLCRVFASSAAAQRCVKAHDILVCSNERIPHAPS